MPGWEIATMYEPAGEVNQVGGDFYEVFRVEGGWALVLGDVAGRGAAAAALTAEARHTIRTAGALAAEPVAGLEVLNRNLRVRDDVALCSVAMLFLPDDDAPEAEALVYLAGHPHPMLIHNGRGRARRHGPARCSASPTTPNGTRSPISFEAGDQVVLYTDGVIEARRRGGERFGTERLRDGLAGAETPELAVERVREGLVELRRPRPRGRRCGDRRAPQRPARGSGRDRLLAAPARATSSTSAAS